MLNIALGCDTLWLVPRWNIVSGGLLRRKVGKGTRGLERYEDVLRMRNRMFCSPIFTCHLSRHSSSWNLLSGLALTSVPYRIFELSSQKKKIAGHYSCFCPHFVSVKLHGLEVGKRNETETNSRAQVGASKHILPVTESKRVHESLAMLQDTKDMKRRSVWLSNDLRRRRTFEGSWANICKQGRRCCEAFVELQPRSPHDVP